MQKRRVNSLQPFKSVFVAFVLTATKTLPSEHVIHLRHKRAAASPLWYESLSVARCTGILALFRGESMPLREPQCCVTLRGRKLVHVMGWLGDALVHGQQSCRAEMDFSDEQIIVSFLGRYKTNGKQRRKALHDSIQLFQHQTHLDRRRRVLSDCSWDVFHHLLSRIIFCRLKRPINGVFT